MVGRLLASKARPDFLKHTFDMNIEQTSSDPTLYFDDRAGKRRCWWCSVDPLYVQYHDNEWGQPLFDNVRLYEKVCLEGFQAGLSWWTVLRKRESFRDAFDGFDFERVVSYKPNKVEKLLKNEKIIRHRGKIESTINNARRAIEAIEMHGSLAALLWQFRPVNHQPPVDRATIQATTPESTAMSKHLRKIGWTFVGPTTCYAMMQSVGMVNDHLPDCALRRKIKSVGKLSVRLARLT